MELHFTYTIDDLRDGLLEGRTRPWRRQARVLWIMRIAAVLSVLSFIAAVDVCVYLWQQTSPFTGVNMPPRDLWLAVLPALMPAALVWIATIRLLVKRLYNHLSGGKKLTRRNARLVRQLNTASIIVAVAIVTSVIAFPPAPTDWRIARPVLMLIGVAPWVLGLAAYLAVAKIWRNDPILTLWNKFPSLSRPKIARLSEDGCVTHDQLLTQFFKWGYFTSAFETAEVLVLAGERNVILPKRCFESLEQLESARAMIQNHVPNAKFNVEAGGFPVLLE